MVVLDKLPNLDVTIQLNGAEVQEYNDDEEVEVGSGPAGKYQALRTVSRYIEAIDGGEFSIKCSASPQFKMDAPNLRIDVLVDGNPSHSILFRPGQIEQHRIIEGPTTFHPSSKNGPGRWTLRKFRFSKLDISNEESRLSSLNKDKAEAEKIGTIEVRIWRASAETPVAPRPHPHQQKTSSNNKFHEKALKGQAKSHNVSYSTEIPIPTTKEVQVTKIDGNDYPVAIYKFKYRSKESLKQLLIIERTPELEDSPTPDPELDVDVENLTPAQRERLKVFLRNEGIANRSSNTPERKIKRERDSGEGSSDQARRKKPRTTQFVDLTADSDEDG